MDQRAPNEVKRDDQSVAVTKKDRRLNPIFVHSALDDYGLTPNELRVYVRIARRAGEVGTCWESIPNMARSFHLSDSTVRRCCEVLALARLISEVDREGYTTERRISPVSSWKNKAELPGIRKVVFRSGKRHTPITRDRGITKARAVSVDGPPLSPQPGGGLSQQKGLPLSPERDEGNPSEGIPIEVNPKKEIPHTEAQLDADAPGAVCVVSSIDFIELDEAEDANPWDLDPFSPGQVDQYVRWCKHRRGDRIHNPTALAKSILKNRDRYDYLKIENALMDIQLEEEAMERREAEEEHRRVYQEEQSRLAEIQRAEEQRIRDEEEKLKAEEWERNAPQREREQLETLERERKDRVESCKRLIEQFAHKPNLAAGLIDSTLGGDEQAKAEFNEWLASQKAQAA